MTGWLGRAAATAALAASLSWPAGDPAAAQGLEGGRPAFEKLRQDEDWSALCDPARRSRPTDPLKCLRLDDDVRLTLGGELRERYEYSHDPAWGAAPQDPHGVFLQRYALHGDLRLGPRLRLFGQLFSALEEGRAGPPSPIDENRIDLQQAFADLSAPLAGGTATLRLGRQELRYGSARLVDVREGPNVRRKFDGARLRLGFDDWSLDALAVRPSLIEPGSFDDGIDNRQTLWGLYGVLRQPAWLPAGNLDLYYLGYENEAGRFDQGTAEEIRHSLGLRLWGSQAGWDWNGEAIYQFGRFGAGEIRAWSLASDGGYTWAGLPAAPRLGLSANVASGDSDRDDADLGSFNALFPRGNYFSELALLGPRNFFNLRPSLGLDAGGGLTLAADLDFFWRLEKEDGLYGPGGGLLRSGAESGTRFVGSELSLTASWQVAPELELTAIYGHFFPGAFIRETGPSDSVDFVELTLKAQF